MLHCAACVNALRAVQACRSACQCQRSLLLEGQVTPTAMCAGTLKRAGAEEQVAVNVFRLGHISAADVALARRELQTMSTVSRALAGHVFRLRGFCERGGELQLAMEVADETLAAAAAACPGGASTQRAG
jgi:hypothetical protein